jgi:hypothetical protein
VGNYAVQISWEDGFSQIAAYELLDSLPRLDAQDALARQAQRLAELAGGVGDGNGGQEGSSSSAQQILRNAQQAPSAAGPALQT